VTEPDFLARTRESYDTAAEDLAEWLAGELAVKPLDRAVLAAFAEFVTGRAPAGLVAGFGSEAGSGAGSGAGSVSGPGLGVEPVADPGPGLGAGLVADPRPGPGAGLVADPRPGPGAGLVADPRPGPGAGLVADPRPGPGAGLVADIGCGAGRLTAHLDALGVPAFGVDLSPRLIEVARRTYPTLRFEVGSMLELDLPDGELAGVLAWYSVIHVPDDLVPRAFAEFHRVLAPGGYLQLAFQAGSGTRHLTTAGRHEVSLDFHRRQPDEIANLLRAAGFTLRAKLVREPDETGAYPEQTQQAFILARKPPNS
jgi:SAM-dependent methyltransferase